MKTYKVVYERQTSSKGSFWRYAAEIINARGIVHAHKLATDHLRELKKMTNLPIRISRIIETELIDE